MSSVNVKIQHTSDPDLVRLGGYSVYGHPKKNSQIDINGNLYIVQETNYDNSPSGLDAMVVQDQVSGEISIIYEGTQPEEKNQDVLTDANLVLTNSTPEQYKAAKDYYDDVKTRYPVDHVAGNSLGGGLANYVSLLTGVPSVTLDPALVPEGVLKESGYSKNKTVNITNYCGLYDPLTLGETAGGYGNRLPGKNIKLDFGISWLKYFASNHTGYVTDEKTGTIVDKVTIGEKGTKSYGQIKFLADYAIPTSVWTGKGLKWSSIGTGQKIKIDKNSMDQLVTAMDTRVLAPCKESFSYLRKSIDTVETEGRHLDDRKTTLQFDFDQLLKQNGVTKLMLDMIEADRAQSSIYKKVHPVEALVIEKIRALLQAPIVDKAFTVIESNLSRLLNPILEIPSCLGNLTAAFLDMEEYLMYIRSHSIPLLVRGVDNGFLDGVVDELKAHYLVIEANNKIVMDDVTNFQTHTRDVRLKMDMVDTAVGNAIKNRSGTIPNAAAMEVTPTIHADCKPSNYLKSGMEIRRRQLEQNYNRFASSTNANLDPILLHIETAAGQVLDLLYEAQIIIKVIKLDVNMIRIPFVSFDNKLRAYISHIDSYLQSAIDTMDHLKKLVNRLRDKFPQIIQAFKPYIELAIFNGTQYEAVILYNKAALSILNSMKMEFQDIAYQLSENQSKAITQLGHHAKRVEKNMSVLIEQVTRGTL
ncbi:SA1320 family protein [Bacillus sp. JJ1764]|uniref:SA1320 family protein n=1 Tax=Bacillus sp. JJ1764 TaxID=3122964 RepID=UPI002FFED533